MVLSQESWAMRLPASYLPLIAKVHCAKIKYRLLYAASRYLRGVKCRRDGRVVEGARLESVYTATYRGFEPLSLRHLCKLSDCFIYKISNA